MQVQKSAAGTMNQAAGEPPPAPREGLATRLWRRPRWWILLGIPAGGFLAFAVGIGFSGGAAVVLHHVETLKFCAQSCHEMATPYQEYAQSIHYRNEFGVRAVCADCHVPKSFFPRILRHAEASGELIQKARGYIDTPAKYELHRAAMAQAVWDTLKADNSAECRSCHSFSAMDLAKQNPSASAMHADAMLPASGKTCIDCHQGIAHKLPDGAS
jgi:nitrate/TMAO reductase-like tetraheme cytochrome c subunit